MITGKTIALTIQTFVGRVMPLLCNTLTRFVITFLPRSSHLLISRLQSPSTVILEPERKSVTHRFHLFPFHLPCSNGAGRHDLSLIFSLKPALPLFSFILIKRLFSSPSLSAIRVLSSVYLRLLMFLLPVLIPACNSSSLAVLVMCSAYRLNKQGDRKLIFSPKQYQCV